MFDDDDVLELLARYFSTADDGIDPERDADSADDRDRAAASRRAPTVDDFVRRLLPVIRARINRILRARGLYTPDRADDLCQTVLLALVEDGAAALRRYDVGRGMSFLNYVGLLARSIALRALEKQRAQKRGGGIEHTDLDDADPDGTVDTEDEVSLRRGLDGMCPCLCGRTSARDRLIGQMLHVDGLTAVEVARALGTSRGAIDKTNHKLKVAFKGCLGGG